MTKRKDLHARIVDGRNLKFRSDNRISTIQSRQLFDEGLKYCPACDHIKPLDEFSNVQRKNLPGFGKCYYCIICFNKRQNDIKKYVNPYVSRANYLNQHARRRYKTHGRLKGADLEKVLIRYGFRCAYCGDDVQENWEIDHMKPQSRGGENTPSNIVPACKSCNRLKSDRTVSEWLEYMQKIIDNWGGICKAA